MKKVREITKEKEGKENTIRKLSGSFFLVVIVSCIISSVVLTFKSPHFKLTYLIGDFQALGIASWVLKGLTLTFLGVLTFDVIFGDRGSVREDLFESQKEGGSLSELYFLGLSLSLLSGFLILIVLFLLGVPASYQDFSTPVSEGNVFTGVYMVAVTAPLFEEFLFRFMLLLFPLALYSYWKGQRGIDLIYLGKKHFSKKNWVLLLGNAILFGFAHYGWKNLFSGSRQVILLMTGWKIAQATVTGIILGFAAMKWGVTASITLHWATNTFISIPTILLLIFPPLFGGFLVLLMGIFFLILVGLGVAIMINLLVDRRKEATKVSYSSTWN